MCSTSETEFFDHLIYRGEGNNTIVLGDPDTRRVYRFAKALEESVKCCKYKKTPTHQKVLADTSKFMKNIMRQLLGYGITFDLHVIEVNMETLVKLNERIHSLRPAYRLHKEIDIHCSQILEAPDVTLLPKYADAFTQGDTISVEIKPKYGCIPQFEDFPDEKRRVCRFCMLQYHDSKNLWPQRSEYCPCDLFSGNRQRMRRALHALLITPQVNLRIFKNGIPVFNCYGDSLDTVLCTFFSLDNCQSSPDIKSHLRFKLVQLILEALLHPAPYPRDYFQEDYPMVNGSNSPPVSPSDFANRLLSLEFQTECNDQHFSYIQHCAIHPDVSNTEDSSCQLPPNSILGRILQVQNLAKKDIIHMTEHYNKVKTFLQTNSMSWEDVVVLFSELNGDWDKVSAILCSSRDTAISPDIILSMKMISNFLISMVAKDCSLIISFQKAKSNVDLEKMPLPFVAVPTNEMSTPYEFLFRACVIDLDPKPLRNIESLQKMEMDVLNSFRQHVNLSDK